MQLFELTGIKHFKDKSIEEILDYIGASGTLKVLGAGSNAVALTDGTNVFKFWVNDSAYSEFIDFVQANQSAAFSEFLPKFKSKPKQLPGKFFSLDQPVNYIKMELLEPFRRMGQMLIWSEDDNYDMPKSVGYGAVQLNSFSKMIPNLRGDGAVDFMLSIYADDRQYDLEEVMKFKDQVRPEFKMFSEAIAAIKTAIGDHHFLDISSSNLAMRGKQPVILDPIANHDDLELNQNLVKALGKYAA